MSPFNALLPSRNVDEMPPKSLPASRSKKSSIATRAICQFIYLASRPRKITPPHRLPFVLDFASSRRDFHLATVIFHYVAERSRTTRAHGNFYRPNERETNDLASQSNFFSTHIIRWGSGKNQ